MLEKKSDRGSHDYLDVVVFEKLLFRDVLVWKVRLTVEIKLRFQIPRCRMVGHKLSLKKWKQKF